MAEKHTGDGWTVELDDGVLIWEFLPGMELSAFQKEAYPVYEKLLRNHDIAGMVTDVKLEDPFNDAVFSLWEKAAQRADRAGIERWAIIAEGIKSLSLRNKIDAGDMDTMTTEDREKALEWIYR